tara:strand:- start:451 stop:627 length:177 start_codon:yes stop_codon:yes gene_type:complete
MAKKWRLVKHLVGDTKTAAGHYAIGYRNRKGRFGGTPKPPGTVKVKAIGKKWGVFEYR